MRVEKQIEDFWDTLSDCNLRDLDFSETPFSWSNHREGRELIYERLNQFVANSSWCNLFPWNRVCHGSMAYLDHIPLELNTDGDEPINNKGNKFFSFEAMWVGNEGCNEIIKGEVGLGSVPPKASSLTPLLS